MVRQRHTPGSIIEIGIEGQYYVYAQLLEHVSIAVLDYRSNEHLQDMSVLNTANVLFIVGIYGDVVTKGHWLKVGKLPIREELQTLPLEFIYDTIGHSFKHYNPNTGEITPSTREECRGLECAAVWDSNHVEDRIRDYYAGVPNVWVNSLNRHFLADEEYERKHTAERPQ